MPCCAPEGKESWLLLEAAFCKGNYELISGTLAEDSYLINLGRVWCPVQGGTEVSNAVNQVPCAAGRMPAKGYKVARGVRCCLIGYSAGDMGYHSLRSSKAVMDQLVS